MYAPGYCMATGKIYYNSFKQKTTWIKRPFMRKNSRLKSYCIAAFKEVKKCLFSCIMYLHDFMEAIYFFKTVWY